MASQTRSEVIEDAAVVSEQFRKTVEVTTDQARQTIKAAQEQFQDALTKAQQAQSEMARAAFRWNEQNSLLVTTAVASWWEASLSMLKMATWAHEQAECTVAQALDQSRRAREEGATLVREAADRTRHQQTELIRLAQESARVGLFYAGKAARRDADASK